MIALDLFAGTGWGVACQRLGIEEYGVEIMPEAVATREANGMDTIYNDVWEGLEENPYHERMREKYGDRATLLDDEDRAERERVLAKIRRGEVLTRYEMLIASPPCQTFSMAGGGAGRKALDDVLGLIDAKAYRDVAALRAFGDTHDPRTALVLTPLAHVYRDVPTFVVFEQVPPVLPVWERCAEEMRRWGYSVWTGILNAEQYGVPQTRRRAILIARADGVEAAPPTPTHSRYYSRDPKRLDPGVKPWVSMAEALGWGMTERPFVTAGNAVGRAEGIGGSGGKAAVQREKDRGAWEHMSERPAFTVTGGGGGTGGAEPFGSRARETMRAMRSNFSAGGPKGATAEERGRTMREADQPSVTMSGKPGHWVVTGGATTEMYQPRSVEVPGPPVTGAGNMMHGVGERFTRDEVTGLKAKTANAERVSVAEAAALQSYPPGFEWCGTKTKQFLQIGNAVPPLLAEAILATFLEGRES